jgi:hypothetical protein
VGIFVNQALFDMNPALVADFVEEPY